jgi:hypothetical protein
LQCIGGNKSGIGHMFNNWHWCFLHQLYHQSKLDSFLLLLPRPFCSNHHLPPPPPGPSPPLCCPFSHSLSSSPL